MVSGDADRARRSGTTGVGPPSRRQRPQEGRRQTAGRDRGGRKPTGWVVHARWVATRRDVDPVLSARMSRTRGRDTSAEMAVRRELHRNQFYWDNIAKKAATIIDKLKS